MPSRPDDDAGSVAGLGPVSHTIFRVARLHRAYAGHLLRSTGLYPGQELLMMRLWDEGPQRQVDLVRLLGSDAPTMARTVRRLESAGFVQRSPSPTDGRATIIEATAASLPLRSAVAEVWQALEVATVASMGPAERANALETLRSLERNLLDAHDGTPDAER